MKYLNLLALLLLACTANQPPTQPEQPVKPTAKVKTVKTKPSKSKAKVPPTTKTTLGDPRFVIQFPKTTTSDKTTQVKVMPLADYKMNLEYPASLNLDKGVSDASLAGKRQSPSALAEGALEFKMPISGEKEMKMKAVIDFSVCNAQTCEMIEKEITWTAKPGT